MSPRTAACCSVRTPAARPTPVVCMTYGKNNVFVTWPLLWATSRWERLQSDQIYKSQNASVPYPTMFHSEQKWAHFFSERNIVGYGTNAFWDNRPFAIYPIIVISQNSHWRQCGEFYLLLPRQGMVVGVVVKGVTEPHCGGLAWFPWSRTPDIHVLPMW